MFKYTPNAELAASYKRANAKPYNAKHAMSGGYRWLKHYFSDFQTVVTMQKYWLNTVYMSKTEVMHVPVNGLKISVDFFDVEEV